MIITPPAPNPYLRDKRNYSFEILGKLLVISEHSESHSMDFILESAEDAQWLIDELTKVRDAFSEKGNEDCPTCRNDQPCKKCCEEGAV